MRATNHVLTGSVFAAATVTHAPIWVILPAAFCLHFVLDALPHYGDPKHPEKQLDEQKWQVPLDGLLSLFVLLVIFIAQPAYWPVLILSGVLCASPDLWSSLRFARFLKTGNPAVGEDWFSQFHHKIQWGERPWGIWLEVVWAAVFGYLLYQYL